MPILESRLIFSKIIQLINRMRRLIEFFIRYSVPTNIVIVAILLFGYLGMTKMKSSFFPLFP